MPKGVFPLVPVFHRFRFGAVWACLRLSRHCRKGWSCPLPASPKLSLQALHQLQLRPLQLLIDFLSQVKP